MSPRYYPNLPAPCCGAMPIISSSDFEEEMNEIDSLIGMPAKDDDNSPL